MKLLTTTLLSLLLCSCSVTSEVTQSTSTLARSPMATEPGPTIPSGGEQQIKDVVNALPIELCRIVDVTPNSLPLRSGFLDPRFPAELRDSFSIGFVPLSFEGTPFTETDGQLLQESLDKALEFLEVQTYGQVDFYLETLGSSPLAMTVEESRVTPFKHGVNLQVLANSAWDSIIEKEYASWFDIIIFVVPFHQDVWIGKWEDIDAGRVYIMGGQYLKRWGPWAHEIAHSISVAEDLYTYLLSGLPDEFFQQWDIMDNAEGRNRDMNLWSRWLAGWLPDSSVSCVDDYALLTLNGVNAPSGERLAVIPLSEHSAVAVEYRNDRRYQSHPKTVLVYLIDTSLNPGWGQLRVISTLIIPGQSFDLMGLTISLVSYDSDTATVEIERNSSTQSP